MDLWVSVVIFLSKLIVSPAFLILIIVLGVMLYIKNQRISSMQKAIMGREIDSPLELTLSQIVLGVFAGLISSIIFSYLGIVFYDNYAIYIMFLFSMVLGFFNRRFICFSYSVPVVGILSIVLNSAGYKEVNIDITALVTMIGVLHVVEALLTVLDGSKGSIPIFTQKNDKIMGGFVLRRNWIVPLSVLIFSSSGNILKLPSLWPLINTDVLKNMLFAFAPFVSIMGYSSITFTKTRKEKTALSGISIFFYGIFIICIAQVANINIFFKCWVLFMVPIAHEFIFIFWNYMELKGKAKFVSDDEGMMVLAVVPDSPAEKMGIRCGDKLIEVDNGSKVYKKEDILNSLQSTAKSILVKIKRAAGNIENIKYTGLTEDVSLGILFVPKNVPKNVTAVSIKKDSFKDVLNKFKDKK